MVYFELHLAGADPEISKRGGAPCWPPWLAGEEILGLRWSRKAELTLETISFEQIISIGIFKFSPFLSIKSFQF